MTRELAAACERAVHVLCDDGRVLRAGRASLYILSGLGWHHLAVFLSLRPNIWFVEIVYRVVASKRAFFSRLLFRR